MLSTIEKPVIATWLNAAYAIEEYDAVKVALRKLHAS
jgi:hypothetical protein